MNELTTPPQVPPGVPKVSVQDPTQTPDIGKLAEALAKAQGEMSAAKADTENTFFKSKYANLDAVWDACRGPLSRNGLAVIQTTSELQGSVIIVTTLAHSSGEWIRGRLFMRPVKADPQGVGSAITYGRRYALAAMVGIAQSEDDPDDTGDDDGNAASGRPPSNPPSGRGDPAQKPPSIKPQQKPSSPQQNSKPKVAPKGAKVSSSRTAPAPSSASDAEDDVPMFEEGLAPEEGRMDQAGESGIPMLTRKELDAKLMPLWKPFMEMAKKRSPNMKPVDVILERYQVDEVRQMTDEQVSDLIEFFTQMINHGR